MDTFNMDDPNDVYGIAAFDHASEERYFSDDDDNVASPVETGVIEPRQDSFPLNVTDVKRMILACTQIVSQLLESERLPIGNWLEELKADLDERLYDDLIVEMITNCERSQAFTHAETKLAVTYIKRSLFVLADQIVKERERNLFSRWWGRARLYCSSVVPVVLGNATVTGVTMAAIAIAGVGIGKRALRYI